MICILKVAYGNKTCFAEFQMTFWLALPSWFRKLSFKDTKKCISFMCNPKIMENLLNLVCLFLDIHFWIRIRKRRTNGSTFWIFESEHKFAICEFIRHAIQLSNTSTSTRYDYNIILVYNV